MMQRKKGAIVVCLSLLSFSVAPAPLYTLSLIESPGQLYSHADAINDKGQVVGHTHNGDTIRGFLWENGKFTYLNTASEQYQLPDDINNAGQVVGLRDGTPDGRTPSSTPFLWEDGNSRQLIPSATPRLNSASARGVNEAGQVVGISNIGGAVRPFLWVDGVIEHLEHPGRDASWANDINNNGQVVVVSTDYLQRASSYIWESGKYIDLGTLGGERTWAWALNDKGQVVGMSRVSDSNNSHAYLWDNGVMKDLGTLDPLYEHDTSRALGINESGQIVGYANTREGSRAFYWENDRMIDLNTRISDHSRLTLHQAVDINERGQIVGYGRIEGDRNNWDHAYLLTPDWEGIVSTSMAYFSEPLTLDQYFGFDFWWDQEFEPFEGSLDIAFLSESDQVLFDWELSLSEIPDQWQTSTFRVPKWAWGELVQVRFSLFDLEQGDGPNIYLKNISPNSRPVPEPSIFFLLFTGIIAMTIARRK